MLHNEEMIKAKNWLIDIRTETENEENKEKWYAWGLSEESPLSIVNTTEALLTLSMCGAELDEISKSKQFLYDKIKEHLNNPSDRDFLRYYVYCILGLSECGVSPNDNTVQLCVKWIENNHCNFRGWGYRKGSEPKIFPTFLALWALQKVRSNHESVNKSINWMLSSVNDEGDNKFGWGFGPNDGKSNVACTSYAILTLYNSPNRKDYRLEGAKNWLLDEDRFLSICFDKSWTHYAYGWSVKALTMSGYDIFSCPMVKALNYINKLLDPSGGWKKPEKGNKNNLDAGHKTIPSTFAGAMVISSLIKSFIPQNDIPRIVDYTEQARKDKAEIEKHKMELEIKEKCLQIKEDNFEYTEATKKMNNRMTKYEKILAVNIIIILLLFLLSIQITLQYIPFKNLLNISFKEVIVMLITLLGSITGVYFIYRSILKRLRHNREKDLNP